MANFSERAIGPSAGPIGKGWPGDKEYESSNIELDLCAALVCVCGSGIVYIETGASSRATVFDAPDRASGSTATSSSRPEIEP